MREIKFRAWYEKEKRFLSWDELQDGTESLQTYFNNELSDVSPLMQYTGLKDQNGRDIYERDVVKFHFPNPYNTVVKFKNGHFAFYKGKRMMVDPYYYTNHVWSYAEVIGNVYENPELLEEKRTLSKRRFTE